MNAEQINKAYNSTMDSVQLVNAILDGEVMQDDSQEDRDDTVSRNVEHLELMVKKDYWLPGHDLTPIIDAISRSNS